MRDECLLSTSRFFESDAFPDSKEFKSSWPGAEGIPNIHRLSASNTPRRISKDIWGMTDSSLALVNGQEGLVSLKTSVSHCSVH